MIQRTIVCDSCGQQCPQESFQLRFTVPMTMDWRRYRQREKLPRMRGHNRLPVNGTIADLCPSCSHLTEEKLYELVARWLDKGVSGTNKVGRHQYRPRRVVPRTPPEQGGA